MVPTTSSPARAGVRDSCPHARRPGSQPQPAPPAPGARRKVPHRLALAFGPAAPGAPAAVGVPRAGLAGLPAVAADRPESAGTRPGEPELGARDPAACEPDPLDPPVSWAGEAARALLIAAVVALGLLA